MTEIFPQKIQMCRVNSDWYRVIADNYLVSGSAVINCWFTKNIEAINQQGGDLNLEPGSMVMFLLTIEDVDYIVGGAFLLKHAYLKPEQCWRNLGVRNGFKTEEAFFDAVKKAGGKLDEELSCYFLASDFIFTHANMISIPDEFSFKYEPRTTFTLDRGEPFGHYLVKIALSHRLDQMKVGHVVDSDWPGLYHTTAYVKSFMSVASAHAQIFNNYDFKCAITGDSPFPLLEVTHIRSLYDERFNYPQNCIILRKDFHTLFNTGYITAKYDGDDKIVLEISKNAHDVLKGYAQYDGVCLNLPQDRSLWPSKENLQWHNQIRFENWLKEGTFNIADPQLHLHRKQIN